MRSRTRMSSMDSEGAGHERWMVSYADFITLLFAFFVVMYAISSVNESKYQALSGTLRENFGPRGGVPVGDAVMPRTASTVPVTGVEPVLPRAELLTATPEPPVVENPAEIPVDALAPVEADISEAMKELVESGEVVVRRSGRGIEVELRSALLFPVASTDVGSEATAILDELAGVIDDPGLRIVVEGFTDDRPIHTLRYPSNWELSAARAATVVRLFEHQGVDSEVMSAVGFGPHRPVVPNSDEASRARNRRVVVVVRSEGMQP